ncbi:OLC1v1017234C1 [Oldenlandia corymbosa var. corymbosa]|uniref:OLC1v1017234C1 n=1 Tax=Oldenlandia corymbosa var. corymbosa TaxID=529605 RepID=A0AAV1E926_OLDCO|nr:OLC1v1017234C1 [Oldenlandia corymbosa var. corymbosa]
MKLALHGPKAGASKPKESKTKGKVEGEVSQNGKLNQMKSNQSKSMKSHSSDLLKMKSLSSVKSPEKEVNGTSTTKKCQKNNLEPVASKEDTSRKRKREEEQKKSESKSIKSADQKEKHRKENTAEVKKSNSGMVSPVQSPSRKRIAENGTMDHDAKPEKPKTTAEKDTGGKPSSSPVGGKSKSSDSEAGKKTQTENGIKLITYSRKPKPGTSGKNHSSVSVKEETGSSRSNGQAKNAVQRKCTCAPLAKSVNVIPSRQHVKKTMSKATRREPPRASVQKSKSSSARVLKVMRALGLAPPVGSPFIRQGATP